MSLETDPTALEKFFVNFSIAASMTEQPYVLLSPKDSCAIVYSIPYLHDNYGYLVIDPESKDAAVVDCVVPEAFKAAADALKVKVTHIFTTHRHQDHSAGNILCEKYFGRDIIIIGSTYEVIPNCTRGVSEIDTIHVGVLSIYPYHTPPHTRGHLTYRFHGGMSARDCVFTGDFLFSAGCGRFFEGSAEEMRDSIKKLYKNCAKNAYVYPGHEYTLNNLRFALTVEPDNKEIKEEFERVKALPPKQPSHPSTLEKELKINVFVRCVMAKKEMPESLKSKEVLALLSELRAMKDKF